MGVKISDHEMKLTEMVETLRDAYGRLSLEMEQLKTECVRQVREAYENGRSAGREEGRQEESYYEATYPGS